MALDVNLDMDALRTFVRGFELGSFARAATAVGRSPSAVSGQLRKLEAQVGLPLVSRAGRGVAPTPAGEALVGYAKRLLELNDEALDAIQASRLDGTVRLGLPPDFAESWLPGLLGQFARSHPRVRIEVRADRSSDLVERVAGGQLDLALAWSADHTAGELIAEVPVGWIARAGAAVNRSGPLALVVFDDPCPFRRLGLAALDKAGIPWRLVFVGGSLPGLWAAVDAGLGVTMRTAIGLPAAVALLDPVASGVPVMPPMVLALHRPARTIDPLSHALAELVVNSLKERSGLTRPLRP